MADNNNKNKNNNNKYSTTVLLPKTEFPMRAGLVQKEPKFVQFWDDMKLYEKMLKLREGAPVFMLHDGPPYANGRIHIGHALDKTLKDIVIKSRTMDGYQAPYIPGWDCHGLPIETALMKELKIDKKSIKEEADVAKFRAQAREFAGKFIGLQKDGFKRLGVQGDFENYYSTMAPRFEGNIISVFLDFVEKGMAYRGKKTISWCPTCETALADAETEYKDKVSVSIYLRFNLADTFKGHDNASLVVWTTTPWTIPANKAAAVNKDEQYIFLKDNKTGEYYIVAEKLADTFIQICNMDVTKEDTFAGEELVGVKYKHPLTGELNPVIWTDFVAMDTGVGIVHIAPGHGEDDFHAGLNWKLDIFCPVDEKGVYTKEAGACAGEHVFKANMKIVERLQQLGNLIKQENITHSYPHCWRCKQPIIFRTTEQWFLSIDGQGLRGKLTDALAGVKFYPEAGRERITSMVRNRPDWCLTRQRFWGTPTTIFYCEDCGKEQIDAKLFAHIKEMALRLGGDFWFDLPNDQILPAGYTCKCGGKNFKKEKDILDVWLDAGCSWKAVLLDRGLKYPADLYSEGSDQHRGWFQTSLIPSVALEGQSPFKAISTHGFVLDQEGKAMHKSLGNSVEPHEVFDKYGADILRLWVSLSDYHDDIRISDEILGGPVDSYRKFRNTLRYAMGSLFDFDPKKHKMAPEEMTEMDRYMLSKLGALIDEARAAYNTYEFRRVVRALLDFCILDLSSFMLDASKDRLYTIGTNAKSRRSAQNALYEILLVLLKFLAPVVSFTTEEAWQELKKIECGKDLEESIFLSSFPKESSVKRDAELEAKWDKIRNVREVILKKLEEARAAGLIGSSLEAKVIFATTAEAEFAFLEENKNIWPEIAIVSAVEINKTGGEALDITVQHADGAKCPRCWQWKTDIGTNTKYPELCARCASVLEEEGVILPQEAA
ncbi:isoleucyl-tRNA synthetase [Elusimicrobium simillimum]|uniref:isoleucine--tRNA ligase n=1 Tax=Elusimicrobium simillimum TaxID=3143438 RepID=UPI003C6F7171